MCAGIRVVVGRPIKAIVRPTLFQMVGLKKRCCTKIMVLCRTLLRSVNAVGFSDLLLLVKVSLFTVKF